MDFQPPMLRQRRPNKPLDLRIVLDQKNFDFLRHVCPPLSFQNGFRVSPPREANVQPSAFDLEYELEPESNRCYLLFLTGAGSSHGRFGFLLMIVSKVIFGWVWG
jgi:hypothetical protein